MKSFQEICENNWEAIIIGIIAAMSFKLIDYGRTILEKAILIFLFALFMNFLLSSFQWAEQNKRKGILILLLIVFWLIALNVIIFLIPFLVKFTGML